jgi:hypothetical protein
LEKPGVDRWLLGRRFWVAGKNLKTEAVVESHPNLATNARLGWGTRQNLYRLSQAYRGNGDAAKAQEYLKKAAEFNSLPALNYAFIREKAQKEAGKS